MRKNLVLSTLPKTWLIDIDGTILRHNGYLDGGDEILSGVREFFAQLPKCDKIVLLTARTAADVPNLRTFLRENGLRFDEIICDLGTGERILINDKKPSGLKTAFAINKTRDKPLNLRVKIDENL